MATNNRKIKGNKFTKLYIENYRMKNMFIEIFGFEPE